VPLFLVNVVLIVNVAKSVSATKNCTSFAESVIAIQSDALTQFDGVGLGFK
jgi:hypothetical protein